MATADDVYRKLQQHLDRMPVRFPATESGVEIRLLQRLFSVADARLALELSAIPEPLDTIHKRVRATPDLTADALRASLDDMASRGLILRVEARGEVRYGKLPLVLGIYELQLPRLTAELQRDMEEYEREGFGQALHTRKTTQMRTVPVNVEIAPERNVATYDDVRSYVRAVDGPFAAMNCICRHGKDLLGEPCRQTTVRENCLTVGHAATSMVASGAAHFITREQMLELLDVADREGLVLQPENTQRPSFICCCCGCCCGVLTTAKRLPEPADFFSTNYYAEADEAKCEECGTCLTRCQMDAVSLETGKAVVARTHCIGCGLCVTTCPSGALGLVPLERAKVPPRNTGALYTQIYRDRYGTLGLAAAAARAFLGKKV